jgi:hypothetical protein
LEPHTYIAYYGIADDYSVGNIVLTIVVYAILPFELDYPGWQSGEGAKKKENDQGRRGGGPGSLGSYAWLWEEGKLEAKTNYNLKAQVIL